VKQYAKSNNILYKDALSKAKETYGGSAKSGYIQKLIKQGNFDIDKMKWTPSKSLQIDDLKNKLKDFEREYYAETNSNIIKSAATGRRATKMKYGSATEYYNKYNLIKRQLEQLTKNTYPELKTEKTLKKEITKEIKKMNEDDKRIIVVDNNTPFEIPRRKKIKSPLFN